MMNCKICNWEIKQGDYCDEFYDCVENYEELNGIKRGTWMVQWGKRMNGKTTKKTDSRFVQWSKNV